MPPVQMVIDDKLDLHDYSGRWEVFSQIVRGTLLGFIRSVNHIGYPNKRELEGIHGSIQHGFTSVVKMNIPDCEIHEGGGEQ